MSNKDYDYKIERLFAKYGGEAEKGITRTCGNCNYYNEEYRRCLCYDENGDETDEGCYQHRTHAEQGRLAVLVKKHREEADRLRIEKQRRDGTGDCAECPFRELFLQKEQQQQRKNDEYDDDDEYLDAY